MGVEIAYGVIFGGIALFIACLFLTPLPHPDDPPRAFKSGDKFPPT